MPTIICQKLFSLSWYNLLFNAALFGVLPIWYYMFAKAGKTKEEAEKIKWYIILSVIIGARLGHVIFYQWDYYKHHFLEIFLPVIFSPSFKIGFRGLASHGAAVSVILAIFLYSKQLRISFSPPGIYSKKSFSSASFLWILDHLVILVALGGALIRKGQNLAPSRIAGVFMVLLFSFRFFYEFYKENQVAFENNMSLRDC